MAVLEGTGTLRSSIISSQLTQHAPYGGVVPELASRAHLENVGAVLDGALNEAGIALADLDRIGVTNGPGLAGALLVGVCYAKGLGLGLGVPVYPVNHLEAHLFANLLEHPDLAPPFMALIISGGHTLLVSVEKWGTYRVVGRTRDDAAGEAFDKVAKLLGLGYPGGPLVEQLAREGDPRAIAFPRPMRNDPSSDFSFSGLKTAIMHQVKHDWPQLTSKRLAEVCASFQEAVTDTLAAKTFAAAEEWGASAVILAGGVSRNEHIRRRFEREAASRGLALVFPSPQLCTDNAAMVARTAVFHAARGALPSLDFAVVPSLGL